MIATASADVSKKGSRCFADFAGNYQRRTGPCPHSVLVDAAEDRLRHGQPERFGGLEIDHQLEPGRLLDRQIGWRGALEDLPGVNAELAKDTGEPGSVADQAASR